MRKPTAEEWEKAWDNLSAYLCNQTALVPPVGSGTVYRQVQQYDPRNQPSKANPAPEEPETMTLSEIVVLAEPIEDEFNNPEDIAKGFPAIKKIFSLGEFRLIYCGTGKTAEITQKHLARKDWHFTKRAPRCPTCGRRVEG